MSNWDCNIKLGPYTFGVSDGDAVVPASPTFVLDGLEVSWEFPENAPWPAQPNPEEAKLYLLTKDVANLAGVDRGSPAMITLTSAGNVIVRFTGRVDDLTSTVVRRAAAVAGVHDLWARYEILMSDFKVDLAEALITTDRPVEGTETRRTALATPAAAKVGVPVTIADDDFGVASFDAQKYQEAPALDSLVDMLAQYGLAAAQGFTRPMIKAKTTAGVLTGFDTTYWSGTAVTWPTGVLAFVGGLLKMTFGSPPVAPGAYPLGLRIQANKVDLDPVAFRRSKLADPDVVSITGPFGAVTVPAGVTSPRAVLKLTSTRTDVASARDVAIMYLPYEASSTTWDMEGIVWRPSDADLAALPFPLNCDTETGNTTAYNAQVSIDGMQAKVNPTGDTFYGGQVRGVTVKILNGDVLVLLALAKRLPLPDVETAPVGVTVADIGTYFPAVKINQVDPSLSVYDVRLARKM